MASDNLWLMRISMNDVLGFDEKAVQDWQQLVKDYAISPENEEKLRYYVKQLLDWNERMNLTRITAGSALINDHLRDSLAVAPFLGVDQAPLIADVGCGAGFPGLPLKICFPSLRVILIEVSAKKRAFLQAMIDELALTDCEVCDLDWRTFLRKTEHGISFFLARASLQPEELVRIFKPDSTYSQATLVYWASQHWRPDASCVSFMRKEEAYRVGDKDRRLIFFRNTV